MLRPFIARGALVRVHTERWEELFDELGARGRGSRESGAFLLAPKRGDRRTIAEFAYFDDLDPAALNGGVHLRSIAFSRLWRLCRERDLAVVADVHTHPGRWVSQSGIDKDNPMVARDGHIGIIAPDLGQGSRAPRDCGVHVFRSSGDWEESLGQAAERLLYVGRFA